MSDINEVLEAVSTWQQVAGLLILVLGGLGYRLISTVKKEAVAIKTTLTENNGGGSVKDALDRIENALSDHTDRLEALENKRSIWNWK